ncbi:ATP-binding protein [Gordoniibacillus kamchatkensis]|uniref:ATP-binding protein n=1 Tax=Gordoniibacillus kamchatkensis TaxID=1590651 RepID=UPI0006966ED7|nr:ATP-binding protein [Paenibacillus sp. VKM B-2647]
MINFYKDFLLNMFFIFVPLLFYPYILKFKNRALAHRLLLFLLIAFSLVATMSFPLQLHGIIYDFRSIPLTVGLLYGGPQVALLLYAALVVYRYLLGNPHSLLYAASIAPTYLLLSWYLRTFPLSGLARKVIVSVAIGAFIKLFTFTAYLAATHSLSQLFDAPLSTLGIYVLQGLLVALCVYLLESIHKYSVIQEEVQKSEKIKIVSDIAASVAHEIRNPLTSVRGFIQLLGSDGLNKEKRDYYQQICLEELDRAQHIISDYLSLAKPDPEHIEDIKLNDEVTYVANILQTYANYNNVQIGMNMAESEPLLILGDRYKLRQALINIGKNAIEAMPDGGVLQFTTNKAGGEAELCISDTGIGMTPQQISRLGTPYYSTKEKGTGLGTMVSLGIIKKMNGKVNIESEVGKGTEVHIAFPISCA